MKFLLSTIFIAFVFAENNAQSFSSEEIISKSSRYLKDIVGSDLHAYFEYNPNSFYDYKTKGGEIKWEPLKSKKKIKGRLVEVDVRFIFNHPDFDYPFMPNETGIKLDSNLNIINYSSIRYIPDFIKEGRPSSWLTEKQIIAVAKRE